jgi:hypothetical protein
MKTTSIGAALALAALALAGPLPPALAATSDYEFRLDKPEVRKGSAVIATTLVDKRTGQAVAGAVVFAKRLDMQPSDMETMTTPLEALPPTAAGVYRFRADLPMGGRWRLSLGAKVQGESGTVESRLVLEVKP